MSGLNMEKLRSRLDSLNSGGGQSGGMDFYSIKDGRNVLRVLPPAEGRDMFFEETWVHYAVGATGDSKGKMIVCPKTHGENKACPVCKEVDRLRAMSKKKDDKYDKAAREIARKKRVYYNVLPMDEDDYLDGFTQDDDGKWMKDGEEENPIKVLGTGIMIMKELISIVLDPEYGDITDPKKGLDIIITKTGSGFDTDYAVMTKRKESPIAFADWKDAMHDLTTLAKAPTVDEIKAIMSGDEESDEDDYDEDDDLDLEDYDDIETDENAFEDDDEDDYEDDYEDDDEEYEDDEEEYEEEEEDDEEEDSVEDDIAAAIKRRKAKKKKK